MESSEFAEQVAAEIESESAPAAPEPAAPAPEPEAAAAPESAAPEPAAPAEPQPRQPQMVPAHVLAAERRSYQQQMQALNAKLAAIEAAQAPKPPPMPDPGQEPLAFLQWQKDNLDKQQAESETKAQADQRAQQEQEYAQQVIDVYAEAADEAREVAPDWDDAYSALTAWGHQQLREQGYRNPRERAAMLQRFEFELVAGAIQQGLNPAQVIYNKAFEKAGYKAAPAPAPAAPTIPPFQAPAAAAAAAPPAVPRDPSTGQFKPTKAPPKSLSHAPGAPGGQLTAEAIMAMSGAEFDKITANGGWKELHAR